MEQVKDFLIKYRGAIIGGIIAVICLICHIYRFLIGCLVIFEGIFIGNYVQQNKEDVKSKLKGFIDKM